MTIHTKENPELFGHEEAEKLMLDAYNSGSFPHSWIITGPKGIGKANLAYRFTRFLLSQDNGGLFSDNAATSFDMDEEHPTFSKIVGGSHPDLLVLETNEEEGSKEILVDQVRKVEHFLSHTSAESGWRVIIVDSADEMNRNAANALLKTLEEPPAKTIILLISHNIGRLLPTIRSRCRVLSLKPLADKNVVKVLKNIEGEVLDQKEAAFAAKLSDGSPGFAVEIYANEGLKLYSNIISLTRDLPDLDVTGIQNIATDLAKKESGAKWRIAVHMLEHLILNAAKMEINQDQGEEFVEGEQELKQYLFNKYSIEHLVNLWESISKMVVESDGLNMDRKMTTIRMFGELAKDAA